jgi:predicted metalloprotease with PDZ domain
MERRLWIAIAVVVFMTSMLLAGEHKKCTMGTQECLDTMVTKLKTHGWMGIEMEIDEATSARTIKRVVPGSPAEKAGFQAGDVLVALNGVRFGKETEAQISAIWEELKPGKEATYTVARNAYERQIAVTLAEAPSDVLAQWVGYHMLEHCQPQIAKLPKN